MSNHDEQYALAQRMTAEINEALANLPEDYDEAYEYICEHIGDPLEISATLSSVPMGVLYGYESANMADYLDEVEVLLGTGGPARGITFRPNGYAYCWHQDWGTPRVHDVFPLVLGGTLGDYWGIEL